MRWCSAAEPPSRAIFRSKADSLKACTSPWNFCTPTLKSLLDSNHKDKKFISAKDKDVIVIGGGDTGTDCVGTSLRHGCKTLTQFEILPKPPDRRAPNNPWPEWPKVYSMDYGQVEAAKKFGNDPRAYSIVTQRFEGDANGNVKAAHTVKVEWVRDEKGQFAMKEVAGTEKVYPTQLVLLAMGFLGPEDTVLSALNVERDPRSNAKAEHGKSFPTSIKVGVFAAA